MDNPEVKTLDGHLIIAAGKYASLKEAVSKERKNLRGADLRGADLRDAYLRGADLRDADLRGAYLRDADLRGADLRGAYLRGAYLRDADLRGAYLRGAYLWDADLRGAYLRGAYLRGADLRGAYLWDADLRGAYLRGAYLRGAYLQGADLDEPLYLPELYALKLQAPGTIFRFWKYLIKGESPYQHFTYEVGKEYTFEDCDIDETIDCGKGGNVGTLVWCLKDSIEADEFMEVEFRAEDIGAIPLFTDGKFRVRRFKTLRIISRSDAIELLRKVMRDESKAASSGP